MNFLFNYRLRKFRHGPCFEACNIFFRLFSSCSRLWSLFSIKIEFKCLSRSKYLRFFWEYKLFKYLFVEFPCFEVFALHWLDFFGGREDSFSTRTSNLIAETKLLKFCHRPGIEPWDSGWMLFIQNLFIIFICFELNLLHFFHNLILSWQHFSLWFNSIA